MSYHCSEDEVDTGILETRLMNRGFARRSCVPPHRTDAGTFLLAECYGCATHMLVKDVDGLYDDDPKAHPAANLIREITIGELKQRNLPTLPFDLRSRAGRFARDEAIMHRDGDRLVIEPVRKRGLIALLRT